MKWVSKIEREHVWMACIAIGPVLAFLAVYYPILSILAFIFIIIGIKGILYDFL